MDKVLENAAGAHAIVKTKKVSLTDNVSLLRIGNEQTPLIVFQDFMPDASELIEYALEQRFVANPNDFYPGIRTSAPNSYKNRLVEIVGQVFQQFDDEQFFAGLDGQQELQGTKSPVPDINVTLSALSINNVAEQDLKPIQMLPHFDSTQQNQWAVVHYLCSEEHGGTSFYRHKSTGFERISESRLSLYGQTLKKEAMAEQLHLNPKYIRADNQVEHRLFESIHSISAKFNKAVLYPSNLLHSGDINPALGLSEAPNSGRFTISSFISINQ